MGAGGSVARNDVIDRITVDGKQTGTKIKGSNLVEGLNIVVKSGAKLGTIKVGQGFKVKSDVAIKSMTNVLAEAIQKASAETQTGVGISYADARNLAEREIDIIRKNSCFESNTDNTVKDTAIVVEGEGSELDAFIIDQVTDLDLSCMIDDVAEAVSRNNQEAEAKSTGWLAGGWGSMVLIVIAAAVAFGFGVNAYSKNNNLLQQQMIPEEPTTTNNVLTILIAISLIFCLAVLGVYIYYTISKSILTPLFDGDKDTKFTFDRYAELPNLVKLAGYGSLFAFGALIISWILKKYVLPHRWLCERKMTPSYAPSNRSSQGSNQSYGVPSSAVSLSAPSFSPSSYVSQTPYNALTRQYAPYVDASNFDAYGRRI